MYSSTGPGPALPTAYTLDTAAAGHLLNLAVFELDATGSRHQDVEWAVLYTRARNALVEELHELFPSWDYDSAFDTACWLIPEIVAEITTPRERDLGLCDYCEKEPARHEHRDYSGEVQLVLCVWCEF